MTTYVHLTLDIKMAVKMVVKSEALGELPNTIKYVVALRKGIEKIFSTCGMGTEEKNTDVKDLASKHDMAEKNARVTVGIRIASCL